MTTKPGSRPLLALLAASTLAAPLVISGAARSNNPPAIQFKTIDVPGAVGTSANGISANGDIVGSSFDGTNSHGFLLRRGKLTTLNHPSAVFATVPTDINDRGTIIGYYDEARPPRHGFVFQQNRFTTLDHPAAVFETLPSGINERGDIVGIYVDNEGTHGFLFQRGVFTTLNHPDADGTLARGINDQGTIAGGFSTDTGAGHGFTFRNGVFQTVDMPGTFQTDITDISASGQLIGTMSTNMSFEGFVQNRGVVTVLRHPLSAETTATIATGINANNTLVGVFNDASGKQRGFSATLPR